MVKKEFPVVSESINFRITAPNADNSLSTEGQTEQSSMFRDRLNWIADNRAHCFFVSPHLDDAVYSAGSLISFLAERTPVTVITLFTKPTQPPYTKPAESWVRSSGHSDAEEHFRLRKIEDANACSAIGAKPIHYDYVDAAWRRKTFTPAILNRFLRHMPSRDHLYPGKVKGEDIILGQEDTKLVKQAQVTLKEAVSENNPFVVFGPTAVGGHIDHRLTREIVNGTFESAIYWVDFPYSQRLKSESDVASKYLYQATWQGPQDKKIRGVLAYESQNRALFGRDKEINLESECYYFDDTQSATTLLELR